MKIKLTLDTLKSLDMGKISAAFDHELRHVVKDCIDRPGDESTRTVALQMTVKPEPSDGVCDTVMCEFTVTSKVPPRRSRQFQLQAHARGDVLVNTESPDDVRQGTLDEIEKA
jgi:hypothetical protein